MIVDPSPNAVAFLHDLCARATVGRNIWRLPKHGYRFLKEKMWDAKNGGFYWEVDASGNQKLKSRKHLYGQAFGLYALSEILPGEQEEGSVGSGHPAIQRA